MKKQFNILAVSMVIIGLTAGLLGMVMFSEAASVDKNQNSYQEAPKPIHATNIKIAKKIPAFSVAGDAKGAAEVILGKYKRDDFPERAATGVLGDELVEGAEKYAVVIGICDYPVEGWDICLSDGDARNMNDVLVDLYDYNQDNIYLLRDMEATREAIRLAIEDIKSKAVAGDEVVFFFSGHGADGIYNDDNNDDIANGNDEDGIDEGITVHDGINMDFIWDGELRSWFDGFATNRIAFIFDTCLAGGMNDVAGEGRVVVMSSKETQSSYVYSYGEYGEGMFSRHFVNEGMLQGLADGYNQIPEIDDNVAVEEAFDYVKENLPPYLKFRQNPVISDEFEDDLVL